MRGRRTIVTFLSLASLLLALGSSAQVTPTEDGFQLPNIIPPNPVIKIPGLSTFSVQDIKIDTDPSTCPEIKQGIAVGCLHIPWIGQYLAGIYRFAVIAATILAVIVLMVAGFMWLTAAGNVTQISQAKTYMGGAMLGLTLMLGSYTILNLINPKLVEFQSLRVAAVQRKDLPSAKILDSAQNCLWRGDFESLNNQLGAAIPNQCHQTEFFKNHSYQGDGTCGNQPLPGDAKTATKDGKLYDCCCQIIRYESSLVEGIAYQTNIENQKADATPALANLLNCMQTEMAIIVTSISDSDIATGACNPSDPNEVYGSDSNCAHGKNSAHYGGNNPPADKYATGFSCAVDLKPGGGKTYNELATAAVTCGAAFHQCERKGQTVDCSTGSPDHLHASVPGCGAN